MGLFNRKPKDPTQLPARHVVALQEYGEHLAGQPTNYRSFDVDIDMLDFMQRDPDAYVELLAAGIGRPGPDTGAFCLGAAETVAVVSGLSVSTPVWDRIVDGASTYLRELRIPYQATKPYMKEHWAKSHSPEDW